MHLLTVVFGPASVSWLFQKEELANSIFSQIEQAKKDKTAVAFTDEFGQRAVLDGASIYGLLIEDMEKSKLARVEHMLHNTRVQSLANKMAQSDPALKAAMLSQGPAMLSPMGGLNGRFPQ